MNADKTKGCWNPSARLALRQSSVGRKDFPPCGRASVLGITLVAAFAHSAECRKLIAES